MSEVLQKCGRHRNGALCGREAVTRSERSGTPFCRVCARALRLPLPDAAPKPRRVRLRAATSPEVATDPDEMTVLRATVESFGVALAEIRDAARWQSRGLAWIEERAERALAEVQP
jgi:hypothetical protein